ncbi:hypothetical protein PENTCL1PPCAC_27153, partial [Pristionchus entomophagus]
HSLSDVFPYSFLLSGSVHLLIRSIEGAVALLTSGSKIKWKNHNKISLFLLIFHFVITILFFYNFNQGIRGAIFQLVLAIIHASFLIYNAHGYFYSSTVWDRLYSCAPSQSPWDLWVLLAAMTNGLIGISIQFIIINNLFDMLASENRGVKSEVWDKSVMPRIITQD